MFFDLHTKIRCMFAIRQAPRQRQPFCVLTTQKRQILACFYTPRTMYSLTRFDLYYLEQFNASARDTSTMISNQNRHVKL